MASTNPRWSYFSYKVCLEDGRSFPAMRLASTPADGAIQVKEQWGPTATVEFTREIYPYGRKPMVDRLISG